MHSVTDRQTDRQTDDIIKLSTVDSRVFTVAGRRVRNSLPDDTTSAPSLTIFGQRLELWLFRQSYQSDLIM